MGSLRLSEESQLAARLRSMTTPKTVYGWLNDGIVPDLLAIVKAGIGSTLGLSPDSQALSTPPQYHSLSALEVAMAKDRSLRKAIDELYAVYMARNVDPKMWEQVRVFLSTTHESMRLRRQSTGESQRKTPAPVRVKKPRREDVI